MGKKVGIAVSLLLIVLIIIGFVIPIETLPSRDTRIILEHTYQTYIAPICFEQSNPTNFIEEATLEKAQELNYPPHDACTEEALKAEKDSLFISLLKDMNLIDKKWDNW